MLQNIRASTSILIKLHEKQSTRVRILNIPIVSIVNLLVGVMSLSNALLRRRVDESKSMHSAEFDDSSIL